MKKRFKKRNKFKIYFLKILFLCLIVVFSFGVFFKYFYQKIKIDIDNEKYINFLVNDALGNYNIGDFTRLTSTEFLLKYSLGIEKSQNLISNKVEMDLPVEKEEVVKEPIVYLFNSHQTEEYKTNFIDTFNINNTVLIASYILKEYLTDLGLNVIVEDESISNILDKNNWKYGKSYQASRLLLEKKKAENPSLKYFIDIHRDSAPYKATVTEIEGVNYAKMLFVVGLEHDKYEENLHEAERLNEIIANVNVSLTRGVMQKKGKGVNGIYNQDFSKYTFLIEIGGQYNTIAEINNSLKVLAKSLFTYINEVENEKET